MTRSLTAGHLSVEKRHMLHDSHGVPLSMDVIETHGDDTFS